MSTKTVNCFATPYFGIIALTITFSSLQKPRMGTGPGNSLKTLLAQPF